MLLLAPTCTGSIVVFTNRVAWETAVLSDFVEEDFNATPLVNPLPQGSEFDVGKFNVFVNSTFNQSTNLIEEGSGSGSGSINGTRQIRHVTQDANNDVHEWRFDVPITAMGAEWNAVSTTRNLTITIGTTGDTIVLKNFLVAAPVSYSDPNTNGGFLGFTSDTAFSKIGFSNDGDIFRADNVVFSATPEPSSILLFGIGLFASSHRRRIRNI